MTRNTSIDEWGPWPIALGPEKVALLRAAFEETAVILEHRFHRGSRSPERVVFESFESLDEYLRTKAHPGDSIWTWRFEGLCRDDNALTWGKVPDEAGHVPKGGAY
ncbi:MAG TPA: hypothetical protein VGL59_25670 [Polyangia bacterium]